MNFKLSVNNIEKNLVCENIVLDNNKKTCIIKNIIVSDIKDFRFIAGLPLPSNDETISKDISLVSDSFILKGCCALKCDCKLNTDENVKKYKSIDYLFHLIIIYDIYEEK